MVTDVVVRRDADDAFTLTLARAMAPEGRLVARSGRWMLFESALALRPIDAREPVDPRPMPPSLAARIHAMGVRFPFPRVPIR